MTTTLDDSTPCKKCKKMIDPLAVFPGGICLECHAKKFDAQVRSNGGILPRPDFTTTLNLP